MSEATEWHAGAREGVHALTPVAATQVDDLIGPARPPSPALSRALRRSPSAGDRPLVAGLAGAPSRWCRGSGTPHAAVCGGDHWFAASAYRLRVRTWLR
jgi:hypothetical protein